MRYELDGTPVEPVSDKDRHDMQRACEVDQDASYLGRYDLLSMASPREAVSTGAYADMLELTSLKSFVPAFAAHIAAEAARQV